MRLRKLKLIKLFLVTTSCLFIVSLKASTTYLDIWVRPQSGILPYIFTDEKFISNRYYSYDTEFRYPSEDNFEKIVNARLQGNDLSNVQQMNEHPFLFIYTSHEICHNIEQMEDKKLFLVILVKSSVKHFSLRNAIRKTWGRFNSESKVQIRFLLGFREDAQPLVAKENKEYGDIIQQDFVDHYYNNTYKTIMGYNWIVHFCSHARFIFFVDDDMFVNVGVLVDYLSQLTLEEEEVLYSGVLATGLPARDSGSRWQVKWEDYPYDTFPPYLSGGAILTSQSVVRKFQAAFPYVMYFKFDDVYLGIVAKKLSISFQHNELLDFVTPRNYQNLRNLIANHGFKDPDVYMETYSKLILHQSFSSAGHLNTRFFSTFCALLCLVKHVYA